jgi:hypothetical protein
VKTLQQATEVTGVANLIPLVMEIVTESIIDQALVASTKEQLEKSWKRHGLFIGNAAWKYPRNGTVDPEKKLIVPVNFLGYSYLVSPFSDKTM